MVQQVPVNTVEKPLIKDIIDAVEPLIKDTLYVLMQWNLSQRTLCTYLCSGTSHKGHSVRIYAVEPLTKDTLYVLMQWNLSQRTLCTY